MSVEPVELSRGDILIADDDINTARLMAKVLTLHGYHVTLTTTGADTLQTALTNPPELILLDILMEDMDGYEVCQQLKADPRVCHIPVIFLSALKEVTDKVKAFSVGGADFIHKPFEILEALARIEHQLQLVRLHRQLQHQQQELLEQNQKLQQEIYDRQQAEAHLEALFRAMTDLVVVRDREGRCLKIAPTSPYLFQPAEEMIGKKLHETFPTLIADLILNGIEASLATKHTLDLEYNLTIQGQETWFSARISPLSEHTVIIVARDMTDRKRFESALWNSEARHRALVRAVPDLLIRVDQQGHYLDYIPPKNFEDVFSAPRVGKSLADVLPAEIAHRHMAAIQAALQTGETQVYEQQFQTSKKRIYEEVRVSAINDHEALLTVRNINERKQAEDEIRQTQRFLDSIVEHLPVMLFVKDAQTLRFVRFNKAGEELLGIPREELLGKSDVDFFPPEEADFFIAKDREVLTSGQLVDIAEEWIQTRHKGKRLLHTRKIPIMDEAGKPQYLLGISEDITEHKEAEEALRRSEAHNRAILTAIPDLMSIISADGIFLNLVRSNFLIDIIPQQLNPVGKHLSELLPLDIVDKQLKAIQDALTTGNIQVYENCLEIGNRVQYEEVRIVPYSENSILSIVRDITDRKQAEEALRLSEERNRALLLAIPDLLTNVNAKGFYISFARGNFPIDLIPVDVDPVGKHLSELLPPDIAARKFAAIRKAITTGEIQVFEQQILAGEEVYFEEVRVVPCEDGTALCLIRNINDRKKAELELQQAMEAAEAANRTKSEFLANMSHELRTPLNAILGFTQVIARDNSLSPSVREYVGIINRSGEHLLNLINDVLEMSKIEAGRTVVNSSQFDLHDLLNSLEEMLQLKAQSKGLRLMFDFATDVPRYIETDEGKLRQVLLNLLGNAIKFTQQGQIILRVSDVSHQTRSGIEQQNLKTVEQHPVTLHFEVEDTGSGIDPNELDNLFEPFVQSRSGSYHSEGTGLGLPISRRFVQLMGGSMAIESAPGQGTIVRFDIQATQLNMMANQLQLSGLQVIAIAPDQPTYRVLIVEDHPESRQLLVSLMKSIGFEVQEAPDGKAAIQIWKNWRPHFIWMDIRMPIMDGYEVTRRIRAAEAKRTKTRGQGDREVSVLERSASPHSATASSPPSHTVIIALTASAFEEERAKVLAAGCDDFVRKPFREAAILNKMTEHLGVQFLYAPSLDETTTLKEGIKHDLILDNQPVDATWLREQIFSTLSMEWIRELHQAANLGSDKRILELIDKIPETHSALIYQLTAIVKNFNFDQLLELIQLPEL